MSALPLFSDVNQAMRIGLFKDLSALYDDDNELNKAELNQKIMDAGCVGTERYVIPLRYTMPVLFFAVGICRMGRLGWIYPL